MQLNAYQIRSELFMKGTKSLSDKGKMQPHTVIVFYQSSTSICLNFMKLWKLGFSSSCLKMEMTSEEECWALFERYEVEIGTN